MSTKYRIYCTEPGDEGFQYIWTDTPPTTCPNNAAHSVNSDSVGIVSREVSKMTVIPTTYQTNRKDFTRIASVIYNPETLGELRRIKILGSGEDSDVTSYSVEVYNRDTKESLCSGTFSNINSDEIQDLGVVSASPVEENILEIYLKRDSNKNKKVASVTQITFYAEGL